MDTPTLVIAGALLIGAVLTLIVATRRPPRVERAPAGTPPLPEEDIEVQSGQTARMSLPSTNDEVTRLDSDRVLEKTVPMGQPSQLLETEKTVAVPSSAHLLAETRTATAAPPPPASAKALPRFEDLEDEEVDPTRLAKVPERPTQVEVIVLDEGAANDEATSPGAFFVMVACAQTDRGLRRKRNEDSVLLLEDEDVYVVADGMGGHSGGEIASQLAVQVIANAFKARHFPGPAHEDLPERASELVRAVGAANTAVHARETSAPELKGMGTTVCAARFAPNKRRFYIAHVGDSRMYRLRKGELTQLTSDHTLAQLGVEGKQAGYLSRAVGPWENVMVDVLLGEPIPDDVYLLCSDGLTKMLTNEELSEVLMVEEAPPEAMVNGFIAKANRNGGRDNITVIVMKVMSPPTASS